MSYYICDCMRKCISAICILLVCSSINTQHSDLWKHRQNFCKVWFWNFPNNAKFSSTVLLKFISQPTLHHNQNSPPVEVFYSINRFLSLYILFLWIQLLLHEDFHIVFINCTMQFLNTFLDILLWSYGKRRVFIWAPFTQKF